MKLYENDSYCRQFTATVVEVVTDKDKVAVVLNQTAFYPEGGGQPSDQGTLDHWQVVDVRERQERILHYLTPCDTLPQVGDSVTGKIDWARRFAHMQNHTGEHLFSGLVHSHYGYENVGFHMGSQEVTMDFSGELTAEQLQVLEYEVNGVIWENRPIVVSYPDRETLATLHYRSKKEIPGQIRLVDAGGIDCCACCGTHTATTGEVGMLKILSHCRYKGGTRVAILCGTPLLAYLQTLMTQTQAIGNLLSVKQTGLAQGVEKQKQDLADAKFQSEKWQKTAVSYLAQNILNQNKGEHILHYVEDLTMVQARLLAVEVSEHIPGVFMVYGNGAYAMASQQVDVRPITKEINGKISAKGGGNATLVQGSYRQGESEIPELFVKLIKD